MLNAAIFPLAVVVLMTAALVSTYVISVAKGDEAPFWPYISDGGVFYPESNVFAQLLDMVSFAAFCTFCVRLRTLQDILRNDEGRIKRLSTVEFIVGAVSLFGMTLVGNFQENRPDGIHFIGAALLFLLGTLYTILDTILSFFACFNHPTHIAFNSLATCVVRVVIATLSVIFIILTFTGKFVSEKIWHDAFPNQNVTDRQWQQRHWVKSDPGYNLHILGSASEWVVGVTYICYFCTFIRQFKTFNISLKVKYNNTTEPASESSHLAQSI